MLDVKRLPLYLQKILIGLHGSLHAAGRRRIGPEKIVACVFSIGERTEEQSVASIHCQTVPVSRVEIIKDVCPISQASNRALDLSHNADYLLWVDADMILYEHCSENLLRLMRPDTLYAVAPLIDPVFGKVGYVKLLNMHCVKRLDLRFRDVLGCDVDFCQQAKDKDKSITTQTYALHRKPLGIHHPTYTARELFRKNQIEKKKRGNRTDARLLLMLSKKYLASSNPVLLAGMLGEILPNPDPSEGESCPESGLYLWDSVKRLLNDIPDDVTYGFSR